MNVSFESISISEMFDRPFSLELAHIGPQITAIYAENGRGKTTLAIACGILLNPDHSMVRRSDRVSARLRVDGTLRDISISGRKSSPDWPCSPRPNLYRLGIEDLVVAKDTADRDVLLKALGGGVDLARLLPSETPRIPQLREQRAALVEKERQASETAQLEANLESLISAADSAHAAKTDAQTLRTIQRVAAHRARAAAREAEVAAIASEYPGIALQTVDAAERIEQGLRALAEAQRRMQSARDRLLRVSRTSAEVPLSAVDRALSRRLRDAILAKETERVGTDAAGRTAESERTQAERLFVAAGGESASLPVACPSQEILHAALAGDRQVEDAKRIEREAKAAFDSAEAVLSEARGALAGIDVSARSAAAELTSTPGIASIADRVREREVLARALGDAADRLDTRRRENEEATRQAENGVQILIDWLKEPIAAPVASPGNPTKWIALIGFVVLAALAALEKNWIGAGIAAIAFVATLATSGSTAPNDQTGAGARRREIETAMPQGMAPVSWNSTGVASRLHELIRSRERSTLFAEFATEFRASIPSGADTAELDAWRDRFARATGVAIEDPYRLHVLVEALVRRMDAESARDRAARSLEHARAGLAEAAGNLRALLDGIDGIRVDSGAALREASAALVQWIDADRRHGAAMIERGNQIRELEALSSEARALMARYAFVVEAQLVDALEIFPEWFDASAEVDASAASESRLLGTLEATIRGTGLERWASAEDALSQIRSRAETARRHAALSTEAERERHAAQQLVEPGQAELLSRTGLELDSDPAAIQSVLEEFDREGAQADRLREDVGGARTAIAGMQSMQDLAEAERALESGIDTVDKLLSRTVQGIARKAVRAEIERRVREENTPEVIERANHWLRHFTGGRYDRLTVPEIPAGALADSVERRELTVIDRDDEMRWKTFSQLSMGARAHLTLAVRVAVIEEAEKQTPTFPLVMDEVLATSGVEASTAIASAVHAIARHRQVLFLTNDPNDLELLRTQVPEDDGDSLLVVPLSGPIPLTAERIASEPKGPELVPADLPMWQTFSNWPEKWRAEVARTTDSEDIALITDAVEAIRERVAGRVRLVTWPDVLATGKVSGTMQDRVEAIFVEPKMAPRELLRRLGTVPRFGRRTITEIEEWLSANGFLSPPPSEREMVAAALPLLEGRVDQPGLVALGLARFFESYCDRSIPSESE